MTDAAELPLQMRRDAKIAGHLIPAGSTVLTSLPAANRDRSFRSDPGRLDITRGTPSHLAFGHGVHRCLGAPRGVRPAIAASDLVKQENMVEKPPPFARWNF